MTELQSRTYEVADAAAANELYQKNGWTDGLPIVPPTEEAVKRFLEAAALAPGDLVGIEPVRRRRITAEKVAIAAVMAGCLPEYLPVVVAAVKAMCEPIFGLHGSTASTVSVGYTPGYYGTVMSSDGVVVYGTGYVYPVYVGTYWYPPPVTYGWGWGFSVGFMWGFAMGGGYCRAVREDFARAIEIRVRPPPT